MTDRYRRNVSRPAVSPSEPLNPPALPGVPARLYGAALRNLAARAALACAEAATRAARALAGPDTARNRAIDADHPSVRPTLSVVPGGHAQGRADLQLTWRSQSDCCPHTPGGPHSVLCHRRGHGASEGDPSL